MEHRILIYNDACEPGLIFASNYETLRDAWDNCQRGEWMCWYAEIVGVDKRTMTLVAGLCAETVIHLMNDERSINAVKDAIAYGRGEINEEKLSSAASDASKASAASAASAAWAAVWAAKASAASAAKAAAEASGAAVWADANKKQTSEICRKYLTDKIKW